MDIKTGLSIYNKQWLIEPTAAMQMLEFWEKVKAGEGDWDYRKAKGESESISPYKLYQQFFSKDKVAMAPDNSWDMAEFQGFEGATIAIIPVSGPLMKNDFCGTFGTNTLKELTQKASNTQSVKTIIFLHDSPGGTVDGTEGFSQAIKESPKRTISLIQGMMCSADYWIGSSADEIYATSKTDVIGSIGTMCSFYDNTDAMKARGIVLREYYATESTDKNKAFKDAQNGDGKALIQEMLDPLNNVFLTSVKTNRAGKINTKRENVLTGKTYTSEKALAAGLIDGIQTLEYTVSSTLKAIEENPTTPLFRGTAKTQKKNNNMTLADFKAEHPDIYKEAVKEGVTAEQMRVKTWMAWSEIDPEAVTKGINEGKEIDPVVTAQFQVKAISKSKITAISADNPAPIATTDPAAAKTKEEEEIKAFKDEVKANLKKYKTN